MKSTPDTFPLISVILPIYNVEDFLPQCLDSVINQTYQNLEIILVNDGSTDSCPQICEEYAKKDSRIKVIHKKNGGLSEARNVGFENSSGDFIAYVDSDDLLSVHFCKSLFDRLHEFKADVAECGYIRFFDVSELKENQNEDEESIEIFDSETSLLRLMLGPLNSMVWNKLYRREVVENHRFPVGKINEDEYWTYKILGNAKRTVKFYDVLYFYRKQGSSIMGQKYSIKRLDGLWALEERIEYMKYHFPNLENQSIKQFSFAAKSFYRTIGKYQVDPDRFYRNEIAKKIRKYDKFSNWKKWNWKEVVWMWIWKLSPEFYVRLLDYYEWKSNRNSK